uniref:Odorant receptor n=1 Tax=Lutzomyia longipalpis TaxID=7200 RepID=A0A7G3B9I4_LUTLO
MSIYETREGFEGIVEKFKSFLKYSALIYSEEFFQKHKKFLAPIPFILEVISILILASEVFSTESQILFNFSFDILCGYLQVAPKIFSIFVNSLEINGIFEWFHELHRERENDLIAKEILIFKHFLMKFYLNFLSEKIHRFVALTYSYSACAILFAIFYNQGNLMHFKVPFVDDDNVIIHRLIGLIPFLYNIYNSILSDYTAIFIGIYFIGALNILNMLIGKLNESSNIPSAGKVLLPNIIKLHMEIISKLDVFCEVFFLTFIIQLLTSVMLILFKFYLLMQSINFLYFSVLCCIFIQFALFCLFGQIIFNKSERIFTELYQTKWYEMEIKDQKALLLIMKLSQKTVGLKAAGMYDINFVMFFQVTKMCLSYGALLYTLLSK